MVQIEIKMIGNKIADARKRAGLSQAQLSEHLFISPQAVGKWERGESIPDIITFHKMSQFLGVDLYYFLDQEKPAEIVDPQNEIKESSPVENTPQKTKKKPIWDMSCGNWVDADFSGLDNLHEKFNGSNMQNCKFIGSNLSGTKFGATHIENCNFTNADLSDAIFKYSNLSKTVMLQAVLNHTNFIGSTLEQIVFEGVIENCAFENCSYSKITFQNAKIMNTFFKGGRLKRITFKNCQVDRLTYEFLKNGKADLTGVTIMK